jgi:DNA-binding CsgD family transcriptional regulator
VLTTPGVVGRRAELEVLEGFVARLPDGPHAVVLSGPAGIGKTTLWRHAVTQAREAGFLVLETRASGAEAQLSFAGLGDLFESVDPDVLRPLPRVQRRALDGALLRGDVDEGAVPPRVVGTAVRSVLQALSSVRPVVVAVDDTQWLDRPSASAIAFALRRISSQPVGVLASIRTPDGHAGSFVDHVAAEQHSEVALGPLSLAAIHEILLAELGRALPRPTLVKVTSASGGNPFYAIEIARELIRLDLTAPVDRLPVPAEPSALLAARVARLPRETREALLLASCAQAPTTALVPDAALAPAEQADVVRIDRDRIEFTHPLLAAAVYRSASTSQRRAAHRALAEAVSSREERVRHLALAGRGADEALAAELEAVALLASKRGATAGAAELAALAAERTPPADSAAVARRRTALGNYLYVAGDIHAAAAALEEAVAGAPPRERARALLDLGPIRASIGDHARGVELIESGMREVGDPVLAAEGHVRLAWLAPVDAPRMIEHARAALDLLAGRDAPEIESFALQHLALGLLLTGEAAAHDLIERSLGGQRHAEGWLLSSVGVLWPTLFDDFELARRRTLELLAVAEEQGNEPERQSELITLALIALWTGAPSEAESIAREALALAEQIEQPPMACVARYALGLVLAQRGEVGEARRLGEESLAWLGARGDDAAILFTQTHAMLGFAALAAGELEEADRRLTLADEASARWPEPAPFRFHGDQVEAALGVGDVSKAADLVERLERRVAAIPRPWLGAVAARSRALVAAACGDLDGALRAVEQAVGCHEGLDMPFERARTLLVLGELHRRRKEKRLAREALEEALGVFGALVAEPWVERTRAELSRVRTRRASETLTTTEERIALLAADGLSNRLIAERAFVSVGTVEANLSRAYRKLGISSRAQLARALDRR